MREVAKKLANDEITTSQARMLAEEIAPGCGGLFEFANWSDQAKATVIASVIGAIALVAAAKISSAPTQTIFLNASPGGNVQPARRTHAVGFDAETAMRRALQEYLQSPTRTSEPSQSPLMRPGQLGFD